MEAADAGVELVVRITEGIPVQDGGAKEYLKGRNTRLIGPDCWVITPDGAKVGIMPEFAFKTG